MLLRVQYRSGGYDMVKDSFLQQLINSGRITKFYRSTGWVDIAWETLRGEGGPYDGPERRGDKEAAAA